MVSDEYPIYGLEACRLVLKIFISLTSLIRGISWQLRKSQQKHQRTNSVCTVQND